MSLLNQVLQDLDHRAAPRTRQPVKLAAAVAASEPWDGDDRGGASASMRLVVGLLVAVAVAAVLAWYVMSRPNNPVTTQPKASVSIDTSVKNSPSLPRQSVAQTGIVPELPVEKPAQLPDPQGGVVETIALPAPAILPALAIERSDDANPIAEVAGVVPNLADPELPKPGYVPLRNTQPPPEPVTLKRVRQTPPPVKVRAAEPDAKRPLEAARQMLQAGELAAAEQELKRHLATRPDDRQARELLVGLMLRGGRHAEAGRQLDLGMQNHPGHVKFVLIKARLLVEAGDAAKALTLLENAPVQPGGKVELLQMLGALYQQQGRYAEAVEAYRRLLRVMPAAGAAWVGLAISLDGLDDPRALDTYRRALQQEGLPAAARRYAEQRKTALEAGNG